MMPDRGSKPDVFPGKSTQSQLEWLTQEMRKLKHGALYLPAKCCLIKRQKLCVKYTVNRGYVEFVHEIICPCWTFVCVVCVCTYVFISGWSVRPIVYVCVLARVRLQLLIRRRQACELAMRKTSPVTAVRNFVQSFDWSAMLTLLSSCIVFTLRACTTGKLQGRLDQAP